MQTDLSLVRSGAFYCTTLDADILLLNTMPFLFQGSRKVNVGNRTKQLVRLSYLGRDLDLESLKGLCTCLAASIACFSLCAF